jgi:NAD(P)-dependent dehydrogenase (short-subunit alcohol dehydrogenase family)
MRVLACGPDLAAMEDMPRETGPGGVIEVHRTDLGDAAACDEAIAAAEALFGDLFGVVAAGSQGRFGAVEETPEATLRELMEVNFHRPVRLIQRAIPRLRERGRGCVVCVSSMAGRVALPMSGAYSASQYALEGLCDALRLELGVFGVAVVLVEPGLVRRAVVSQARPTDTRALFGVAADSPYAEVAEVLGEALDEQMERASTPQDVANVIHRALAAPRPRARYAVTRSTAALMWARKILPDRFLDSRLAKRMGLDALD